MAEMIKTTTPGIYKRGSRYVVVWRHRGKQHKSFHRTLAEAREAKGDHTGSSAPAPQIKAPFDDYALQWIDHCQGRTSRGFDEDTRKAYKRALELYAIPHFRSKRLCDIDREDVVRLIAKLQRQGLSAASIAKYVAPVRALFSEVVESGRLSTNPALALKINAKASRSAAPRSAREKTLTRAELAAVLGAIPETQRLPFEIMAATGCRISEALGLDCGDLAAEGDQTTLRIERQWYRGTLKPNTKTEAGMRTLELPPELARRLWAHSGDRTGPILASRTGKRLSDRNLRRVLDAACERAAVADVSHHTFRHTHGSMLLDEGWTIAEVAARLGHADPAITAKVYAHKMRDRRRELGFLDVGNPWATEHPETAASDDAGDLPGLAA
jgi:integrase